MIIKIPVISKKVEVQDFLNDLKVILESKNFNVETNFLLNWSYKAQNKEKFSTPYTMLDLEYDSSDVVERLKELTLSEYSETLFDKNDDHPPLLYVFGKHIKGHLIYIKLKIKEKRSKYILCVSFHYAEHEMKFPYKNG